MSPHVPLALVWGQVSELVGQRAGADSGSVLGTAPPLSGPCCWPPCHSGFCGPTCRCRPSLPGEVKEAAKELESQIKERQGLFFDMEAYLPKKNG